MSFNEPPVFVRLGWGRFTTPIVPELHVTEGAQIFPGRLLQHVMHTHPTYASVYWLVSEFRILCLALLADVTQAIEQACYPDPSMQWCGLDHHTGNRSLFADASLRGIVDGCSLVVDE